MKIVTLAAALILGAACGRAAAAAEPLDLYVDPATGQIFAQPAPGRTRLGRFVRVDEPQAPSAASPAAAATPSAAVADGETVPAAAPAQASTAAATAPAAAASADKPKAWYDRLSLRGYTQVRFHHGLDGEASALRSPGDRFIGDNQSFGIRRARVILSGDVSPYLSLYLQPDFASTPTGSSTGNFGQLRDLYADIYFDRSREYRVRVGQSKVPYGWENLQSSSNRLAPDRADSINTAVRDERDLGAFFYYSPRPVAKRFKWLVDSGLKGSGDYGMLGLGFYNGQGANRLEGNDRLHTVAHLSYPIAFDNGQILELGIDGYTGHFRTSTSAITVGGDSFTPALDARARGFRDRRVLARFAWYPQPFGLQGEWTIGEGPELDLAAREVRVQSLSGGYLQAMLRQTGAYGVMTGYLKLQTYDGGAKFDPNTPSFTVDELEAGVEWQIRPEIELTLAYARMDRTQVTIAPYVNIDGQLLRMQLQWNY